MHFLHQLIGTNYTIKKFIRLSNQLSAGLMMRFILIVNSLLRLQKVQIKIIFVITYVNTIVLFLDSPCVPPSANAHELFRGFSFVAPCLMGEEDIVDLQQTSYMAPKATEPYSKVFN